MPATKRQAVRFTSDTACLPRQQRYLESLKDPPRPVAHHAEAHQGPGRLWMTVTEGNVHSAPLRRPP